MGVVDDEFVNETLEAHLRLSGRGTFSDAFEMEYHWSCFGSESELKPNSLFASVGL